MPKIPFAVKISEEVKERLRTFCDERGIKQGYFVERAIEEKLGREEILEDSVEFKRLRHEEPHAIPFDEYLKERPFRTKKSA